MRSRVFWKKPLPEIELRAAKPQEFGMAAQLRAEMAREMGDDWDARSSAWRARFSKYFGAKQRDGVAELFLAFDGGEAVACVVVSILDDYRRFTFDTPSAFVNAVYVRPAYRRRGIASRLMNMAVSWARDRGCVRVRLRTSEDGRALYSSLGFKTGREMELDLK